MTAALRITILPPVYQLVRLAQLIGLNAVPGFGYFARHWTAGTVLALYWIETFLGALLVAARIAIHQRLTHKRGHFAKGSTLFSGFLLVTVVFTIAEGVFLGFVLFVVDVLPESDAVDLQALRTGAAFIAALLVAGFGLDLIGIGRRPFFWIHRLSGNVLGRVVALFFTVYIGIGVMVILNAPRALIVVFMALKTFIDIVSELPESQTGEAPQWQLAIAGLFGSNAKQRFAAFARDANREYGTYQPEDEEVIA